MCYTLEKCSEIRKLKIELPYDPVVLLAPGHLPEGK
jgi:hypothetical protein